MSSINPNGERDEQVVASKIPRREFTNFKKLCDLEEKTPSSKIRELINREVNDKFGGIYKSKYDKEKIKHFQLSAIKDYNDSQGAEEICRVNLVERTDGKFTQIGLRPLIDEDIFLSEGNVHPELPSIGMTVANGERDFLINNILENKEIKRIEINKSQINDFPQYAYDFNSATILIPTDFLVDMSKIFMRRIEYKNSKVVLDFRYNLLYVPGEILKNKILIIEKDAVLWAKEKFHNEFTNKDESLDISIEPQIGGKVDITVRSVNRIKSIYPERIKILEVKND